MLQEVAAVKRVLRSRVRRGWLPGRCRGHVYPAPVSDWRHHCAGRVRHVPGGRREHRRFASQDRRSQGRQTPATRDRPTGNLRERRQHETAWTPAANRSPEVEEVSRLRGSSHSGLTGKAALPFMGGAASAAGELVPVSDQSNPQSNTFHFRRWHKKTA